MNELLAMLTLMGTLGVGLGYRFVLWDKVLLKRMRKKLGKLAKNNQKKFFKRIEKLTTKGGGLGVGLSYGLPLFGILLGGAFALSVEVMLFGTIGFVLGGILGLSPRFSQSRKAQNRLPNSNDLISRVEANAIQALIEEASPQSQRILSHLISRNQKEVSRNAIVELANLKPEWGASLLVEALNHPQPIMRSVALQGISEIDPAALVTVLPRLLEDPNANVRRIAYQQVHLLETGVARPLLLKGLKDPDGKVRAEVATAAQRMESGTEIDWLDQLLEDPGHAAYHAALTSLREELIQGTWQSVKSARIAMGETESWEELLPLLEEMQREPEMPVLYHVLNRLADMNMPQAIEGMMLLLGEKEMAIRLQAVELLRNAEALTGEMIQSAMISTKLETRESLIMVLGGRKESWAIPPIIEFLGSPVPVLRKTAVTAATAFLHDERIYHALKPRIEDEAEIVREEVYRMLHKYGTGRLLPNLMAAHQRLNRKALGFESPRLYVGELSLLKKTIQHLFSRQLWYKKPLDTLLCKDCLTRANTRELSSWKLPQCRRCGRLDSLMADVKQVVGVIGTGFAPGWLSGSQYRVDLWNEDKKEFRYADLDVLEIIGGGDFDYDWAVNAVVEAIHNDTGHPNKEWKALLLQQPNLNTNTLRLLNPHT